MSLFSRWMMVALLAVFTMLMSGGIWLYNTQQQQALDDTKVNLESIARLKVDRILEWRNARQSHASVMMSSRFYNPLAIKWIDSPPPPPSDEDVQNVLTGFKVTQELYGYDDALFVNAAGKVYFHLGSQPKVLNDTTLHTMAIAFQSRAATFSDLYSDPSKEHPQFGLILPFFTAAEEGSTPTGAIIYQYDIRQLMLDFWPVSSRSAETLLVRRDGDSVLFLNKLRHQKNTAMTLRIPLSRTDGPSVMAVMGKRGVIQGKDYRGILVISALESIPDTTWHMVAKVDESEALSSLRQNFIIILVSFLLLVASTFTVMAVVWQRKEKTHYRSMFEAEAALRKSEARYRHILDSLTEGCQIIDFEWRFFYLNATAIRYSGHTKEALLNHTLMELYPGRETGHVFAAFQHCMKERKPQTVLYEVGSSDGDKSFFILSIQPVPEGIFVISSDITESKRAEERLRESESRHRALFEHMIQGAFRQQADGRLLDVNPAALEMFGLTEEEFLGRTLESPDWDVIREDNTPIPGAEHPSRLALRTGKPVKAVAGVFNPRKKSRIWMEISVTPEFLPGETRPDQVLVTLHNITGRKRMEAENSRLVSAIEQSSDIVVILDTEGRIQYVNPAFETITGYSKSEALGQSPPRVISGSQDENFYQILWDTIRSGRQWHGRYMERKKDGTLYAEDAATWPVFDASGAITNYISIKRDITEYLALEQEKEKLHSQLLQSQKLESVGRLAGGVAHDFNNMLNVILGHAQLALGSITNNHLLYSSLEEINKAAQHSAELTNQLLAFARKQTIIPRVLQLNDTVGGLLKMLQRLIGEDINLVYMPGHNLWKVLIDPSQVDQLLTNLTINARDAIKENGRITIETENIVFDDAYCAAHPDFIPGEYVLLSLSDDGCGMDKDTREQIFDPFFTTKGVGEGTGLGLATAFGIVKQNKGFINVYSEPSHGSTFKIYLPRFQGEDAEEEVPQESVKGGTETVLLVEDEISVIELAQLMLERLGYTVMAATTPREAIRLIENNTEKIHLMIVDVVMPEMTGRDLAERLHSILPDLKLIYMSGYTADIIAHQGILDDDVNFIQKPFSLETLATKVRKSLDS